MVLFSPDSGAVLPSDGEPVAVVWPVMVPSVVWPVTVSFSPDIPALLPAVKGLPVVARFFMALAIAPLLVIGP